MSVPDVMGAVKKCEVQGGPEARLSLWRAWQPVVRGRGMPAIIRTMGPGSQN